MCQKLLCMTEGAGQLVFTLVDHRIDFMEHGGCERGGDLCLFVLHVEARW
jgi:hypothetical protein